MYNKLFSKILDSSIWLEPTPTRIVWLMFIAVMDEDGIVRFASIANVAHRARITETEAEEAIKVLESPDPNSADPDNEGRRIEHFNGGWIVLNAHKYRDLVTREMIREQTRIRVARKRERDRQNPVTDVTQSNAETVDVTPVTECNDLVTQSVSVSESISKAEKKKSPEKKIPASPKLTDEEWRAQLINDPTYDHIDIPKLYGRMVQWCRLKKKQPTRARLLNWLNREDVPLHPKKPARIVKPAPAPEPKAPGFTDEQLAANKAAWEKAKSELNAKFGAGSVGAA